MENNFYTYNNSQTVELLFSYGYKNILFSTGKYLHVNVDYKWYVATNVESDNIVSFECLLSMIGDKHDMPKPPKFSF